MGVLEFRSLGIWDFESFRLLSCLGFMSIGVSEFGGLGIPEARILRRLEFWEFWDFCEFGNLGVFGV